MGVSQAYVAWVEVASAMISSIGSTCNIAVLPSVHAYCKMVIKMHLKETMFLRETSHYSAKT